MTQYVRHFLEEAIAIGFTPSPTGYSAVLGAGVGGVVGQAAGIPKYIGDRYLINVGNTSGASQRLAFGLDAANADPNSANAETLIYLRPDATSRCNNFASGARVTGTSVAWSGYFGEVRGRGTATIAIVKSVAGADTDLASTTLAIGLSDSYWIRFRVNGSNLSLKVWKGELVNEPAAWTLTAVDATYASGSICFGARAAGAGSNGTGVLDFISIGTNGDAAPARPVSWAEYLAFLAQEGALRCTLVEIDVLGQDNLGNALTGRLCASNYAFRSSAADRYPNIAYEEILIQAPKNQRRMNGLLRGRSTMTTGDLILKNEVIVETDSGYRGRLDPWFAFNWDGRNFRELYGHPSWRRCDFKTLFLGAIQDIYRPTYGQLGFTTRGLDGFMQRPVPSQLIGGTGPNAAALVPVTGGMFFNADITGLLYDSNALSFQVAPANSNVFGQFQNHDVRDSGVSFTQPVRTITSVNTGTGVIGLDANHNYALGAQLVFNGASLPFPLSGSVTCFVNSIPAANQITVSYTPGGPNITLTTSPTGGTVVGRNYQWGQADGSGGYIDNGRITLLSNPIGRVTIDAFGAVVVQPVQLIKQIAFYAGVFNSGAMIFDAYHGTSPSQMVGMWSATQQQFGQVIDAIAMSVGAAWSQTREGNWYLSILDIPVAAANADWTITSDHVRNWRVGTRYLPSDVERLGYLMNNAVQKDGLASSLNATLRDLYGKPYTLTTYTPAETGLEQPANHLLRDTPVERSTLMLLQADAAAESQRLYQLRRKTRSTYLFDADAWALALELGDQIAITHPRDGFGNGKTAVVVGLNEDPIAQKVEVEVFAQVDGQWPVVTSSNPFAPQTYY